MRLAKSGKPSIIGEHIQLLLVLFGFRYDCYSVALLREGAVGTGHQIA
jgi:hypothetical protein